MSNLDLNDLQAVVDKLADKVRTECHHCGADEAEACAQNFSTFSEFFKMYIENSADSPDRVSLDCAYDQLGLILAKADGTPCAVLEACVGIALDVHQAMKSHSVNASQRMQQCIQSVLSQAQQLN